VRETLAQHQPVTIVTGDEVAAAWTWPAWTPWAGGVVVVVLLGVLLMRWRARTVRHNPLGIATHRLASSLRLTRDERALVREMAQIGGVSGACVMLSSTAFDGALALLARAGKDAACARSLRGKLIGNAF